MARQSNDTLSGLERELELYMGAEYETPGTEKIHLVRLINPEKQEVTATFKINEGNKSGKLITSAYTYTKTIGTLKKETVRHNVPETSQDIISLKKKGATIITGIAPKLYQYDEGERKVFPVKVAGKELANVSMKFEIVESTSILKATATVGLASKSYEYKLQEPVATQIGDLKNFIGELALEQDPDLEFEIDDDEYELDPADDSAGRNEHFLPFFGNQEDSKAELLKLLEMADQNDVNVFVVALQKKIEEWTNKVDLSKSRSAASFIVKGLEKIDLAKAQQMALLAYINLQDRDRVISYVGIALDALLAGKDIVMIDGMLKILMAMKKPSAPLKTLKAILKTAAKTTYKRFTKAAEIERKLAELEALLLPTETMKNETAILARIQQAQAKLQEVERLVFEDLQRDNELEYEEDDDEMDDDDEFDDDNELDDDGDNELDDDDEFDDDNEFENELNTLEDDGVTETFARRLHELSTQSFESEYELDAELDRALDAMENEFMVKRIRRKHKRDKGKGKGLFGKILSTGAKIIGKVVKGSPVGALVRAGTSLVRGDVKGALGGLAKAAVGSLVPGGAVITTAMDALGGGEEGEISRGGRRRRAIKQVARIARDTYREVADTLPLNFDHPVVAHEVASKAVHKAMIKNGVRPPGRAAVVAGNKRIIRLKPGERVVIIGT